MNWISSGLHHNSHVASHARAHASLCTNINDEQEMRKTVVSVELLLRGRVHGRDWRIFYYYYIISYLSIRSFPHFWLFHRIISIFVRDSNNSSCKFYSLLPRSWLHLHLTLTLSISFFSHRSFKEMPSDDRVQLFPIHRENNRPRERYDSIKNILIYMYCT